MNTQKFYFFLYFICLLLLAPINLPSFDTYYYWDWSRHLDLSYYDGSPMIAYFIKGSTLLFGDTLFALTFVGIFSTALSSWIIYKTARQFLSVPASNIATVLWLLSPLVTLDLLHQTTYDTPLTIFWALTLYFVVRFLKNESRNDLYLIGLSIGLMLLSKYSGVVLIVSLVIFLITSRYRYLFRTPQFYLALALSIACFSPVIIWNYQHGWQSFLYQLTTHQHTIQQNPLHAMFHALYYTFLPSLNFMLFPPLLYLFNKKVLPSSPKEDDITKSIVQLCFITCSVFVFFYLFTAYKANVKGCWLTQYLITSALLAGYCYEKFLYKRAARIVIMSYALLSTLILLNNSYLYQFIPSNKFAYYRLIQQVNEQYKNLPDVVFSSGWFEARMLFFLKNKPLIYTIDCGVNQNQYALWSTSAAAKIANKTMREIMFIDDKDRSQCLKKYFDTCEQLPIQPEKKGKALIPIFVYKCVNHRANDLTLG
ncbi:glycosyltransferase family 39 protein [uncultured Legionella sp.]|uniref:glycosyltransferase family 39 protein n=1 Tax=uncultured Legionella sp. TaxID=210934 RepID=UPI0026257749|nr:glycosyltransferase family 39 protein [uncultured Legionella sp.]